MSDLWSDNHSEDEASRLPTDKVLYNLYEDILCLKEEMERLQQDLGKETQLVNSYAKEITALQQRIKELEKDNNKWRSIVSELNKELILLENNE